MKRINLSSIDTRTKLGATLVIASVAALAIGLFAVVSALTDDPVKLPDQGSIQEIVDDNATPGAFVGGPGVTPRPLPVGPLPVALEIPRVDIDSSVIKLGFIPDSNNIPAVPERGEQVGWYDFSAPPGLDNNAVFTGHVDWQTPAGSPIPGAFYRLRELQIGDPITITLEDGTEMEYRVTGNVAAKYDDPNVIRAMEWTSKDVITLITCGGTWQIDPSKENGGNYSHRIIVRAERVTDGEAAALAR